MSNGIKFTPRGGEVSVHLRVTDEDVRKDPNISSASSSDCSIADKSIVLMTESNQTSYNTYLDKKIRFEMIFRDTGCGIS